MPATRPLLAISMGDPAGIGPEVIVKALSVPDVHEVLDVVVYGDLGVLERAARMCHLPLRFESVDSAEAARRTDAVGVVALTELSCEWGQPSAESDRAQLEYIERAVEAVRRHEAQALVTAPINKVSVSRAGSSWRGHTEMLAHLCSPDDDNPPSPVMMVASERLRVVTLTTHVPLSRVPELVTSDSILHVVRVVDSAFPRYFRTPRPRIAVAGLNPHAGEGGLFGDEEARLIVPAIERARADGVSVSGPFPADTIFRRAIEGEFEVVIGMYHDQALTPVKLLDFDSAVNVTLGLPIIRTSVDHGTAYDIAGQGVASAGSMIAALRMAGRMSMSAEQRIAAAS